MSTELNYDFYRIYDYHHDRIKGYILAKVRNEWVADDLTQDTFLRAFRNISSLQDPSKESAWLFRIARNICFDHFRRCSTTTPPKISKNWYDRGNQTISAHEAIEKQQMGACIQKKVSLLPKSYRDVIWLFDYMGFSQREIAAALNLSPDNVKIRLHRARSKLKGILRDHCQIEKDERNVLVCEPKNAGGYTCTV